MKPWLRGRGMAILAFGLIAALVVGGLGWVTLAALRLEQEQIDARIEAHAALALWRLDSHVFTTLAHEGNRAYRDYQITGPPAAVNGKGGSPVEVFHLTPVDPTSTPAWIGSHYLVARRSDWKSPLLLRDSLVRAFGVHIENTNAGDAVVSAEPTALLARLVIDNDGVAPQYANAVPLQSTEQTEGGDFQGKGQSQMPSPQSVSAPVQQRVERDTKGRAQINDALTNRGQQAGYQVLLPPHDPKAIPAMAGPTFPVWMKDVDADRLIVMRTIEIGTGKAYDVTFIDWNALALSLSQEVRDLLPAMKLQPIHDGALPSPDRAMSALPVELDPGPSAFRIGSAGFSPLRIGLGLSWLAALLALTAVGLGGWSLLNLSERRIRFVSAVTHELRTPLTTLRLYLDMLASGMVKDESRKAEYLHTLNAEADRLNLLVSNVLDFSRLENQRPRLTIAPVRVADLLSQVHSTWQARCQNAEKELIVTDELEPETMVRTDVNLVAQILGNLIDNACKYSQGAKDNRIWLRARTDESGSWSLEVEDRGSGVAAAERRSIFRPFRRGQSENVAVGGVGLGLALAQRWARLLGGRVSVDGGPENVGARFRVSLPRGANTSAK